MSVSGSVWLLLRPLRKLGANRLKKGNTMHSTGKFFLVAITLLVVVSGLAYTTLQGRPSLRHDHEGRSSLRHDHEGRPSLRHDHEGRSSLRHDHVQANADTKLWEIPKKSSEKMMNPAISSETESLGAEKRSREAVRPFDKIIKDSLETIFQKSGDGQDIVNGDHKDSEVQIDLRSTAQNIPAIGSAVDLAKQVVGGSNVGNSVGSSSSVSPNNSAVSETNAANSIDKFECPESFRINDPDLKWFQDSIVQKSGKYAVPGDAIDEVLILTPISNVKRHLKKYFDNICSLTYPHQHISIVLGEDSSADGTLEAAESLAAEVRRYFRRVEVFRLKGSSSRTSGGARHEMTWQLTRRRHLAMARNQLLFGGLRNEKWVLWMDSDVRHIPPDIVERLLWPGKAIVVANCLYRMNPDRTDTFDRNTWRDTEASRRHLSGKSEDFLMLEGYEPTQRKTLNDLKEEGDVVRLDGVGGCVLLVEGDLHRKGLVFPSFVFDHHVETEGLAKMAARMGIEMFGLPSVNVIHW